MSARRIARLAVSVVLLLFVITTVAWISDAQAMAAAWSEIFSLSIVLVLLLLVGGVVLSSLRLQLITSDLGYRLTFRDAAMTLSVGQLAGTAFFQLAGQLIGRSAILARRGIPPAATVVISGYERFVALSVSLLLAGSGALYLFGTLSLDLKSGGLSLVKLVLGLLAATVAGALLAWGRTIVDFLRKATWELFFRLLRSFLISLAIQATTLAAYVALELALAPHIGIASLAAASCIVMLAASLPVSFGGWGLRELSAVVALQAIGLSSASALVIALLIGFLSFAVIAGMAIVVMLGWEPNAGPRTAISGPAVPDYSVALDWALPLMTATAVFFQIYIPTAEGRISVNLADPIVLLGGCVFALHHLGKGWPVWRIAGANAWIAGGSAVIVLALLHGWASFGWTDWAFVNKGIGWLILLCYGATGALIIRRAQLRGLDALLRTLAASGAAIALIEIGIIVLSRMGVDAANGLVEARVSGLSQNANAFAFMLLLVLAATIVLRVQPLLRSGLMVVALLGLWFTGSRAGLLALPVVFAAALLAGVSLRPLLTAVMAAAAFVASIAMLPSLARSGGGAVPDVMIAFRQDISMSTYQHLQTIQDGLALFLAHPIIGAGLGAYMDDRLRTAGEPLVIHSTAIWLLAETGLVGFAVFLAAAWRLLREAVRHRAEPAGLLLLLILCALAVMSLVHELLYQRAFWLLLGAALAVSGTAARVAQERGAAIAPAAAMSP